MATIGNTNVESSTTNATSSFAAYMNMRDTYTAVEGDAVTLFSMYGAQFAGANTIEVAVYDVTSGADGATLVGESTIATTAGAGWDDSAAVNIALTAGNTYAVAWGAPYNGATLYRDTTSGSNNASLEAPGTTDLSANANPWSQSEARTDRRYSFYATVTNSGGGGGTTKANLIKQVSRYHLGASNLGRIQRRS